MPLRLPRRLIGHQRTRQANVQLGIFLAAVAGAINAGGFLAVHQYTSHMTGVVSSLSDAWVLGQHTVVLAGTASLVSFLLGAMLCAVLVNFARKRQLASEFAIPLALEANLLLCFGFLGSRLDDYERFYIPLTAALLCFLMGLQNALVSKLSRSEIRTTHVTGIVTDLGIELGKLLYINRTVDVTTPPVRADRAKLRLLAGLLTAFFAGGLAGAWGFKQFGYITTVPIAASLLMVSLVSIWDDVRKRL
ncbi:MAG TPA: YoaK family protein [Limnobacter sp.]|uniref:YoaK family protein n=1 Tax=Limnobacter sp. TaxID=2003368 RepID=UPI002ED8CC31